MLDMLELPPSSVSQPVTCCHAGGAPGDRPQRPVPGHLQHEEEGDGGLTEGKRASLVGLSVSHCEWNVVPAIDDEQHRNWLQ